MTGLGLEWHYHAGVVPLPGSCDRVQAAYANCRAKHTFLTDDNHTWAATEPKDGYFEIVVRKNERSGYFLIKPWWVDDGPGALWFSDRYRVATEDTVRREWADNLARERRALASADACRDTVRGRKAARSARGMAYEAARLNRVLAKRWPDVVAAIIADAPLLTSVAPQEHVAAQVHHAFREAKTPLPPLQGEGER